MASIPQGGLTCRQVLNIMVIIGFMINYMLRVNLTIAMVAMVYPSNHSHSNLTTASENAILPNKTGNIPVRNSSNGTPLQLEGREQTRYWWNEYEQNLIFGSFFWGYICTEIPGGRLAEIIGARRVFGYSMLLSSAITLFTPAAASLGFTVVAALRVLLGFCLGATWPAIHPMTALWIPPNERSKFVSNMMASSLGAAITMPICGYLIASLGWQSVFYVTGGIGFVWSVSWFLLVFDSPAQHPRISDSERRYIEEAIGNTSTKKHFAVPWISILTSPPVWAIIITHACSVFGYFTVVNQLPTYMKNILHFNIKENGLLSSLPYLGKYLFALAMSTLADYLRQTNRFSVTAIRKTFTTFAVLSPGLLMVVQANFGNDPTTSVAIFTLALTLNGAVTAGYLGNGLDIAPNFSGTIFGIANTLSSLGGFLSTFMVGSITNEKSGTFSQWRIIFYILSGMYIIGAMAFAFFGTGTLQKWNSPEGEDEKKKPNQEIGTDGEESVPLKNKNIL
ncbi:sialin isoform X2 [Belonocnema kinseyi]|uniref:sialin isoform X2 n=1 Tax=Belonocnema kinseyi TaxID=2817044 RepID=UPI00143D1713|nr:sialin isoform X2 [Belonocnema kinseyi]